MSSRSGWSKAEAGVYTRTIDTQHYLEITLRHHAFVNRDAWLAVVVTKGEKSWMRNDIEEIGEYDRLSDAKRALADYPHILRNGEIAAMRRAEA